MSKKNGNGIKAAIVLLVIALIAVVAVIVWKQWEYSSSTEFYDSLRGALHYGGILA